MKNILAKKAVRLGVACAVSSVALLQLTATPASAAATACGRPDGQFWPDSTQNRTISTYGWGRLIYNRYNPINNCGWGKITGAVPDQYQAIWVDHSTTGGNGWEGPLASAEGRGLFGTTTWFTDGSYKRTNAVMRVVLATDSGLFVGPWG